MSPTSALLGALVASLWQGVLVALAFALLRPTTSSPPVRYALALTALAAQLAWPGWTFARLLERRLGLGSPETFETSGHWHWVPALWAAGAAVMLLRTAGGLLVVRRWLSDAPPPGAEVLARLEALRARLGVRAVRWAASARLTVPLTVGALRPVVLLPASLLTAVPGADLELLAAHELMHVRRWDYLVNLGQAVVEAALFFHPAVWWVSACAREEREYCCDDAVVSALGGPRSYARALLCLEQALQPPAVAVPSTGGPFMKRIRRILAARSTSSSPLAVVPLVGLLALLAVLGSCAASTLRGEAPLVSAPPALVPALRTLCGDLRAEVARPELAKVDKPDLLTVVLADLGERNPGFEAFLADVSKSPAPQRRETFVRSVSAAIGSQWECADFDALWTAGQ